MRDPTLPHRRRATAALLLAASVLTFIFLPGIQPVRTAGPLLAWDEDPASIVTGFAVTVDGIRTDYGLTPQPIGGPCGCSIPLPFTNGRHIVDVSSYNSDGETSSPPFVVGPTANGGGPYTAQAGTALTVSGTNSTDNVGTITTYTWNWGDGSTDSSSGSATATGTYASAGTFTITLTVADDFGASHSATTTATIMAVPPPPGAPTSPVPAPGATGVSATPTLTWTASGATSYDVQLGAINPPPPVATGQTSASYSPSALTAGTTYFWRIVARSGGGSTGGPVWSFTTVAPAPGTPGVPTPGDGATGVSATPTLTWTASGATSYDVQFGAINPPPQIATGQPSASYTPGPLVSGTTYFWRIVAYNSAGTASGPVWTFTTGGSGAGGVPAPWLNQDVGSTGQVGSATYASGTFAVEGAGADIWGSNDGFQYVYQGLAGDGQIIARVTSMTNTNTFAKAGIMIRESLAANAAHVMVDMNPTNHVEFETRSTTGAATTFVNSDTQAVPTWLKLTRSGSTFAVFVSADGFNWRIVGSTSLSIATNALVGLIVTSHNTTTLNTSTFDNVSVSTSSAPPPPPGTPGSPTPANGATGTSVSPTLMWTSSGAISYDVQFGTTNPPPQVTTAQTASSYTPAALTAGTTYFWQIVAHNSAGTTPGPGWTFTTASASAPATDIVIYANDIGSGQLHGSWAAVSDPTSPSGLKLITPDVAWATINAPLAAPADYVDVTFTGNADTPYTLWLRLRALNNIKYNDSIWVQFSDAQVGGAGVYPIGSSSGLLVNLATDTFATSLNGWGWKNGAYWLPQATTVTFAASGSHTLRIQVREDGVQFDQIVLSPTTYLTAAPGAVTNDSTIVKK